MPLQVLPMTEADIEQWQLAHEAVYATGPVTRAIFTRPLSASTLALMQQGRLLGMQNPRAHHVKVVDTDTGEAISWAKYMIHTTALTAEDVAADVAGPPPVPESNEEAYAAFSEFVKRARMRLRPERAQVYLAGLVTRRDCQRRGAGGLLLGWGVERARELGLDVYLLGSEEGVNLYRKFGFEVLEEYRFDMSRWGVEEEAVIRAMRKKVAGPEE